MLISLMLAFITCAAGLCVFLLTHMMSRSEELARMFEVQIQGLSNTHMLGLEAVTTELDKLKARLKEIEEEVL